MTVEMKGGEYRCQELVSTYHWCQVPSETVGAGEGQAQRWLGRHLDACLTGLGKLKRRFGGRVMIYFYRALFSHWDQLMQWFLTWEN